MHRLLLAPLCALAAACAGGSVAPPAPEPTGAAPVAPPSPAVERPGRRAPPSDDLEAVEAEGTAVGVRRIRRWERSPLEESRRLVIRDAAALARFWDRLGAGKPPAVNFDHELVVAAAAGTSPGGSTIAVGRTVVSEGILSIEVLETIPWPNCPNRDKVSRPLDVVAISAEGVNKWRFVEREKLGACGVLD